MSDDIIDVSHDRLDWQNFLGDTNWSHRDVFNYIQNSFISNFGFENGILKLGARKITSNICKKLASQLITNNDLKEIETICNEIYLSFKCGMLNIQIDSEIFVRNANNDQFGYQYIDLQDDTSRYVSVQKIGLSSIARAKKNGVPFEYIFCEEIFGKNLAFRDQLHKEREKYINEIPIETELYFDEFGISGISNLEFTGNKCWKISELYHKPEKTFQYKQIIQFDNQEKVIEYNCHNVWSFTESGEKLQEYLIVIRYQEMNLYCFISNFQFHHSLIEQLMTHSGIVDRNDEQEIDAKDNSGIQFVNLDMLLFDKSLIALSNVVVCLIDHHFINSNTNQLNSIRDVAFPIIISDIRHTLYMLSLSKQMAPSDAIEYILSYLPK